MALDDDLFWTAILTALLLAVTVVDARTKRIPDALNAALVLTGLAYALLASRQDTGAHAFGAIAGFLSLGIFGEIFFRLRGREGLGLGDAKLFAGAGAWLGWRDLPFVLLVASLAGLVAALVFRKALVDDRGIAFGPFLAFGILVMWLSPRLG